MAMARVEKVLEVFCYCVSKKKVFISDLMNEFEFCNRTARRYLNYIYMADIFRYYEINKKKDGYKTFIEIKRK